MAITGEIARWLTELKREDIPDRVIAKAKLQLLNVLASLHAGYHTEEGQTVLRSLEGGSGPVRAIPSGRAMHHLDALCADACLSMVLDYDDYLFLGHTGHSAVNVPLALGELLSSTASEILVAQVIANEVAGRMGAAVALGPRNGQMWSYIHHAGAACAAARLLRLSAGQAKTVTAAWPVLSGVRSAFLAREGLRGEPGIIEGPQGFLEEFAFAGAPFMFTGWGRAWVTDNLACKPYPGCAYIDTAVDALRELLARYAQERGEPLTPEKVERVEVQASVLTARMNELSLAFEASDPLAPININFSIPKSLALTIMDGNLSGSSLAGERLRKQGGRILELARRVTLSHDWGLTGEVVRSLDDALRFADVLDQFTLRQLMRTALSLREHFAGGGFSPKDLRERRKALPVGLRGDLLKVIGRKALHPLHRERPGGYSYDLGEVNMDALRLPFPAVVTLRTADGFTATSRVDIPLGSPGREGMAEVVREKFAREASRSLPPEKVELTIDLVEDFEAAGLARLLDACCIA